jgi:hypothetical protein
MEHGHIPDRDIAASSTFDYHSVGPHMGRARQDAKGGAWCPAQTISSGVREWIEINLHTDYRITATETMGRFGGGQGQEFAQTYQIEYWRQSTGKNTLAIYPQVLIPSTHHVRSLAQIHKHKWPSCAQGKYKYLHGSQARSSSTNSCKQSQILALQCKWAGWKGVLIHIFICRSIQEPYACG